jgi:hypothetical protein
MVCNAFVMYGEFHVQLSITSELDSKKVCLRKSLDHRLGCLMKTSLNGFDVSLRIVSFLERVIEKYGLD